MDEVEVRGISSAWARVLANLIATYGGEVVRKTLPDCTVVEVVG